LQGKNVVYMPRKSEQRCPYLSQFVGLLHQPEIILGEPPRGALQFCRLSFSRIGVNDPFVGLFVRLALGCHLVGVPKFESPRVLGGLTGVLLRPLASVRGVAIFILNVPRMGFGVAVLLVYRVPRFFLFGNTGRICGPVGFQVR
jgi:hypothetical protein